MRTKIYSGADKVKKKYFCVISNDDGITAAGLKAVYEALEPLADILVSAPDTQRSGASHSISCDRSIRVKKVRYGSGQAYSVSGTPADCAKLALLTFAKRKPDLFISGVNHGPNIAQFVLYSGTVGAAAEAAILGVPALAFSIDEYAPENFVAAVQYIRKIALKVLQGGIRIKKHTLLNVNFPDTRNGTVKGVKIMPKGFYEYAEKYIKKSGGKNGTSYYWHIIGKKTIRKTHLTDADAVSGGFITITPLDFDLNDDEARVKLKPGVFMV